MRAAAVALALAPVLAQTGGGTCAEDYDCNYAFVDSNSNIWTFDFAPLCNSNNGGDWIVPDAGAGHNFSFNICGYSSQRCLPKGYTEKWQYGAVVQTWDAVPFCDPNNASTLCNYTRDDGSVASDCCTQNCEVLGVGTPIWSLTDPTNPASGGVTLKYTSVPRDTDDSNSCGLDPITQAPIPRSVTFNLRCSRGALGKDIYNIVVSEPKTCQYQINASSPLACGCEPMCGSAGQDNRICGSDGCGGYCSSVELEGDCPWANGVQQVCNYDTGTCCRPDCTGRQCGDDGCGGSCGACGAGETCSGYQVCITNPNYPPQFAIVYAADSGSLIGGFIGGVITAFAVAGAYIFTFKGGRERFDKWRFADSTGGSLLTAKAAAPSLATAAGSSAGGYGGLGSTGGGGYGSTTS